MLFRKSLAVLALCATLAGCATNEATGRKQFTGLMDSAAETRMGSGEQQKAQDQYGVLGDSRVQAYVNRICNRLLPGVERRDVTYTCTVLDSPVVNAFALPGGYVNITRGALEFANSEDEVASVLAHEMGHVAARHISERYTQSTLTQLGATALSIGIGSSAADQLFGVGANLFLASYSRSQESEADDLGIRYLSRAGYDPRAMASFLANLQRQSALEAAEEGAQYKEMKNFMATHPLTGDRVARATSVAAGYPAAKDAQNPASHFAAIDGLVYGDSPKDGFVSGHEFVHPGAGFAFAVPAGFRVKNLPDKVLGESGSGSGAAFVFDIAHKEAGTSPAAYITQGWTRGTAQLDAMEDITVNGMRGATAQAQGRINGKPALLRLVAIEWSPTEVFRFTFALPPETGAAEIDALKRTSYSLRHLSQNERQAAQPMHIALVRAGAGMSVDSLARQMPFDDGLNAQRFRALNGMNPGEEPLAGQTYKTIR